MAAKGAKSVDPLRLVSALIETSKVDTVYRDAYLDRARTFLDGILSLEDLSAQKPAKTTGLPENRERQVVPGRPEPGADPGRPGGASQHLVGLSAARRVRQHPVPYAAAAYYYDLNHGKRAEPGIGKSYGFNLTVTTN